MENAGRAPYAAALEAWRDAHMAYVEEAEKYLSDWIPGHGSRVDPVKPVTPQVKARLDAMRAEADARWTEFEELGRALGHFGG